MAVAISPVPTARQPVEVELANIKPTGPAAAALVSGGLGVLAMAISQIAAEGSEATKNAIHNLGKLWIPGAQGIGPYSGKETIALVVWLASWAILHYALRRREVSLVTYGLGFLVLIGLSTTMLWPPVTHEIVKLLFGK